MYEYQHMLCHILFGEIKRFIRDDGDVKVSRSIKELAYISVLNLVNFSILAFVLTAVISLVECVVGMIIPCCKIIKKSPIDAIRCEE